jgi:hypothetical protein
LPGELNSVGVYEYAEDDAAALYSDLLNKLGSSITALFTPERSLLPPQMYSGWVLHSHTIDRTAGVTTLDLHLGYVDGSALALKIPEGFRPLVSLGAGAWQGNATPTAVGVQIDTYGDLYVDGFTFVGNDEVRIHLVYRSI